MNRTKIPWCDWTWNPIVGCSPASRGCANCYAEKISKRFYRPWGKAHWILGRLHEPALIKKPARVFLCSMSDLGHETVLPFWRSMILNMMTLSVSRHHTYIVLTKRPGPWLRPFGQAGVLCGVTVEDNEARWRLNVLYEHVPAHLAFASVEPMLEPVSLRGIVPAWVIAGPETGPKARPCEDAWIEALSDESHCFFDKREQWTRREFPEHNAALTRGGFEPSRPRAGSMVEA